VTGPSIQTIRLRTSDGIDLAADLAVAADVWAGAVVCHPHPDYGGDRHNSVVDRLFHTLAGAGVSNVRFDFRPAGAGGRGAGEQHDVVAALDRLVDDLAPGLPLWLVGYSFGADIALSVDDERVAGWVAVAPPLSFGSPRAATGDPRPVLVVAADHDQFNPPAGLREVAATWPDATVTVVPGADHFLVGASVPVAETVLAWLRDRDHQPRRG
jgi:alpha/beta superfamily hydrolase